MAVSAVYVKISPVYQNETRQLTAPVSFSNISATTSAFSLKAGKYRMESQGTTFGTITLQVLSPDGTTWLTAATAVSANGVATLDLESGSYRLALA